MGISHKEIEALARATGKLIHEEVEPLRVRLDALEASRADFKYTGIWDGTKGYKLGNFVTHAGAIWHANEATTEKPGASNAWTLAVKSAAR